MSVEALLSRLAERGVELRLEPGGHLRYRGPSGALTADLKEELRRHRDEVVARLEEGPASPLRPVRRPGERFEPFPLTPLQAAYWLGEKDFYESRTPAFFAQEYRLPALDLECFAAAVAAVTAARDILRAQVGEDGTQRVAERPPAVPLRVEDLRGLPPAETAARVAALREGIEEELPPLETGPPFAFAVQLLDGEVRLHVALRLLAFDGISTAAFYREVAGRYRDPELPLAPEPLSYRDYVLTLDAYRQTPEYRRALAYWQGRLDTLPPAPDLPQLGAPPAGGRLAFRRLTTRLAPERWQAFRRRARRAGLPVNTALAALFVETVRRWSTSRDFTVNVLAANRPAADPGYARVTGNCSTTSLLQADAVHGPFTIRAAALQRQLFADLEHAAVAGVEVIRLLQQRRGAGDRPLMPVVFTSALDLTDGDDGFLFPLPGAVLVHSALKTPQVWLDQQVYEERGELVCNWDFLPSIFPRKMIAAMQRHHRLCLEALAADGRAWESPSPFPLPDEELAGRRRANATAKTFEDVTLLDLFHRRAAADGGRPALVDAEAQLGYGELAALARRVGGRLAAAGVRPGDLVGVHAPKGWRQLAAVLGVLEAGAAYLPLDARLPAARVAGILAASGARAVLTDRPERAPAGCRALPPPERDEPETAAPLPPSAGPGALAYVIYTSGSTGAPKGVMIDHRGAMNTNLDVLDRCGLGADDRVLALSSLGFDLSVFDLFGLLAVGGLVAVPPDAEPPDPEAWAAAVEAHGVTVWNSVPALLEMTLDYLGPAASRRLASLRTILLSGDWIPLPLVPRVRELLPAARLYALGGATEASIWSNFHPVEGLPGGWTSVPYGFPLANQSYQVLDPDLEPAPTWAVGDLYIGGAGVAQGYFGDPRRTAESFVPDPGGGGRLYRTGDLARYRPGGILEFLGRRDGQVKIRGFRIELGEIEATLRQYPGVREAVALVHAAPGGGRDLAAFATGATLDPEALRAFAAARLPSYMVPAVLETAGSLPLTANGKVDRKALAARAGRRPAAAAGREPRTELERRLAALWERTLGVAAGSVDEDFFALGGNSVLAVRLFRAIAEELGRSLPLSSLFRFSTIAGQARRLEGAEGERASLLVPLRPAAAGGPARARLFLIHPVGGHVLGYRELARRLDPAVDLHGLRARGTEPGESPAASLPEMAAAYAREIARAAPAGPLHLGGWSMGGVLAWEAARQLIAVGREVGTLLLIDSWCGDGEPAPAEAPRWEPLPEGLGEQELARLSAVYQANGRALLGYRPEPQALPAVCYRALRAPEGSFPGLRPFDGWLAAHGGGGIEVHPLPEDHFSIVAGEAAARIARETGARLLGEARP
jgi:mycobactin phenyloxazoline synthetase